MQPKEFSPGEKKLLIPAPQGSLETAVLTPEEIKHKSIAIICHPHPLFHGTMNNKVVVTVARLFRDLGIPSIRFNFRGVGISEGQYGETIGETEDLIAVLKWAKENYPDHKIYLAGFSFGSFIAMRVAQQQDLAQLILIAPSVDNFDYKNLSEPNCPWTIIQGDQDEIVPSEKVFTWVETLEHSPALIRIEGASHFFHGRLIDLKNELKQAIKF